MFSYSDLFDDCSWIILCGTIFFFMNRASFDYHFSPPFPIQFYPLTCKLPWKPQYLTALNEILKHFLFKKFRIATNTDFPLNFLLCFPNFISFSSFSIILIWLFSLSTFFSKLWDSAKDFIAKKENDSFAYSASIKYLMKNWVLRMVIRWVLFLAYLNFKKASLFNSCSDLSFQMF